MAATVQCDNCGIIKTNEPEYSWRHVSYEAELYKYGMDTRDLDFCSWKCIAEYAQMRQRVETRS